MLLAVGMLLFFAPSLHQAAPPPGCPANITRNVWDAKFAPGQHWSYHNRPMDVGSTFVISEIDDVPGIGIVIHIHVDRLDFIDKPSNPRGNAFVERYLSIRRDALDDSIDRPLGTVDIPDLPRGYVSNFDENCRSMTSADTIADTVAAIHGKIEAQKEAERKQYQ